MLFTSAPGTTCIAIALCWVSLGCTAGNLDPALLAPAPDGGTSNLQEDTQQGNQENSNDGASPDAGLTSDGTGLGTDPPSTTTNGSPNTDPNSTGGAGSETEPPSVDIPASYARGSSPGCGQDLPARQVERQRYRTDIAKTPEDADWLATFNADSAEYLDRNFSVVVPLGYDKNKPYTLNIIGGGCGGDGQGYGGQSAWPDNDDAQVIFVHPNYKGGCYRDDGVNNPELAFFDVWFPEVLNRYCIDQQRVFMTGFSSGAWNAITHGCARSNQIRGHGSSAGGLRERRNACQGPVAAIFTVDVVDTANPIHHTDPNLPCSGSEADGCWLGNTICTGSHEVPNSGCVDEGQAVARDALLARNGCLGDDTVPWGGTVDDIPSSAGGLYRYTTFIKDGIAPGDQVPQERIAAVQAHVPVAEDGRNTLPACHKYVGCPDAFPVVWCMTYDDQHGGHDPIASRPADDGLTGYQRFFEQDVPSY